MRCKPGDKAIILKAGRFEHLVGRIVNVVRLAVPGERLPVVNSDHTVPTVHVSSQSWICTLADGHPFELELRNPDGVINPYRTKLAHIPIPDRCLQPIRDPGQVTVNEEELKKFAERESIKYLARHKETES